MYICCPTMLRMRVLLNLYSSIFRSNSTSLSVRTQLLLTLNHSCCGWAISACIQASDWPTWPYAEGLYHLLFLASYDMTWQPAYVARCTWDYFKILWTGDVFLCSPEKWGFKNTHLRLDKASLFAGLVCPSPQVTIPNSKFLGFNRELIKRKNQKHSRRGLQVKDLQPSLHLIILLCDFVFQRLILHVAFF